MEKRRRAQIAIFPKHLNHFLPATSRVGCGVFSLFHWPVAVPEIDLRHELRYHGIRSPGCDQAAFNYPQQAHLGV